MTTPIQFTRQFAMPNPETFSLVPVAQLLDRWLIDAEITVDPFALNSTRATVN